MESIGIRIKNLRKEEGLTQKDFSKRLLISQSYLSGIENDNEIPTDKLQKLICLEFGVNENWLVCNEGEMYDDVYENDKAQLVEVSNEALLIIMNLLSSKSNVEYGMYAYILDAIAKTLQEGCKFNDEEAKMQYLELLQDFFANLHRLLTVFSPNPNSIYHKKDNDPESNLLFLQKHQDVVIEDLTKLTDFLAKANRWSE